MSINRSLVARSGNRRGHHKIGNWAEKKSSFGNKGSNISIRKSKYPVKKSIFKFRGYAFHVHFTVDT